MMGTIIFNRTGYDPFIDFVKAYAIICVLIGHTLPLDYLGYGLWAGMQVPLFILIQTFHFYKKGESRFSIKKIIKRIILPFVLIGILEFCVLFFVDKVGDYKSLIINIIRSGGGYGPGSYFPIIYIQIALLLPCFRWVFCRFNSKELLWFFLILVEGLEIVCSCVQPPEWLYRLLSIRYIFLIYLGWRWVQEGIKVNLKMLILSAISAVTIIYFEYITHYYHIDNEPWFFNTAWSFHRWPCYYFSANGLVVLLYFLWNKLRNKLFFDKCIKPLAQSSYEIFLVQMCACSFLNGLKFPAVITIALIWITSILGGLMFNFIIGLVFKKKKICIKM